MYHDLLFALNGLTSDIFQEKYQENSYNLIVVATGLDYIDPCEEAILNQKILPLASHILYLQRFIDIDNDKYLKIVDNSDSETEEFDENSEARFSSYYLLVLRNAVEQILDHYNASLIKLENILLSDPEKASLSKVDLILIPWYHTISTLAITLYNYERKKFNSHIIDEFNTIADSSGNYHTKRWFKYLANKTSSVFINQTKELIFQSDLIDPYHDYFIENLTDFSINWSKIPETIISKKSAKDIVFIARTNQVVKQSSCGFLDHQTGESTARNQNFGANLAAETENNNTFASKFSTEPYTSIFDKSEHENYKFLLSTIEADLEKLKIKANEELIKFVGKHKILAFLSIIKKLFFLNDSTSWKEFLCNITTCNANLASRKFSESSNFYYDSIVLSQQIEKYTLDLISDGSILDNLNLQPEEELDEEINLEVTLKPRLVESSKYEKDHNMTNLDQTFVGDDEMHSYSNVTRNNLCDIYSIIDNGKYVDKLTDNLSKLDMSISVKYPMNLRF